jgi:hypothetical protein
MTVRKFNNLCERLTKEFGELCKKNNAKDWDSQRKLLEPLLVKAKILKRDESAIFWRAHGSMCDFMEKQETKPKLESWAWQCDVAFSLLYLDLTVKTTK